MCMYMFTYWNMEIYKCEYVQNNQLIHKHIHLTIYQSRHWRIGWYVDIIHVRLYSWNMYLNICTYMSQQMQLMYTETPCFGENKRTQQITQNTRKFILRHASKVTISKFRGWRRHKPALLCMYKHKPRLARFFFGGSHGKNDYFFQRCLISLPPQVLPSSAAREAGSGDTGIPWKEHGMILQLAFCSPLNAHGSPSACPFRLSCEVHQALRREKDRGKGWSRAPSLPRVCRLETCAWVMVAAIWYSIPSFPTTPHDFCAFISYHY